MKEFKVLNYFMVEIDLPTVYDNNFLSLIPRQREQITKLMKDGIISTYSLTLDRSKLWVATVGSTAAEVENLLREMPLYNYFSYKIHELAFHNNVVHRMPELSLN